MPAARWRQGVREDLRERLTLQIEIGAGVAHGRVEARMAQPLADRGEIDAGLEERDGRTMAYRVRVNALIAQRRHRSGSGGDILPEQIAHPEPRNLAPAHVDEDEGLGRVDFCRSDFRYQLPQQPRRRRPDWAKADLGTLAVQPHLARGIEPHVAATHIQHLLHPRPGVEHQREQCVVAPTRNRRSIDAVQEPFDLGALEILDRRLLRAALERQADNALKRPQLLGMVRRHEPREHVNGAKPGVARRDAVLAFRFPRCRTIAAAPPPQSCAGNPALAADARSDRECRRRQRVR